MWVRRPVGRWAYLLTALAGVAVILLGYTLLAADKKRGEPERPDDPVVGRSSPRGSARR